MNDQTTAKRFAWKKLLITVTVWVALIVAVIWNVRKFLELRVQRSELAHWRSVDDREQSKVNQLDEWRSVASETFDKIDDDRRTLLSMYRSVRTVDDLYPIHDDHIVFKYDSFEDNSFRLLFFAPEGIHRLGFGVKTQWENQVRKPLAGGASVTSIAEEPSVEAKSKRFWFNELTGGRAYEAIVTLIDADDERAMLRIELTHHDPIEERLDKLNKSGGHSWSVDQARRITLPGQIRGNVTELGTKIYRRNRAINAMRRTPLVRYQYSVTRHSDGRDGEVQVNLFLESKGPLKSLPTDRSFHSNRLLFLKAEGGSNPLSGLKYDDRGWYYIETQDSKTK